jgi:hypothetical protein
MSSIDLRELVGGASPPPDTGGAGHGSDAGAITTVRRNAQVRL